MVFSPGHGKTMHSVRLILLFLLSGGAAALSQAIHAQTEQWQKVVAGANSTAYADPATIQNDGARSTMGVLIDYQKPPFDGNNLPYLSLTMHNEYDCDARQFRVLAISSHSGNMGRGDKPYQTDEPGEWESITAGTVQKSLWKVACEKH
jgi:surface-adhesin protein E